jgi:predicted enzyme related to lactoylglutathione lyase
MATRTSYTPGTPCWIDLNTSDPSAARAFYAELFGWQFETNEESHYATASKDGKRVCGLNDMPITEQPPTWIMYFATDDAQKLADSVTVNGGAVVLGPMQVREQGSILLWLDTVGAIAGAWQPGLQTGAEVVEEAGTMAWHELATRDLDRAVAFYTATLPVRAHDESEGEFHYQTLRVQDRDVAGIWQMSADVPAETPPHWSAYFAVDDTDAVVSAATAHGATVTVPAKDSPYGRFAGLADPQGAAFYVIQPAATA